MQKEINFYQEMTSEHRLQEYCKGPVPLCLALNRYLLSFLKKSDAIHLRLVKRKNETKILMCMYNT